MTNLFRIILFTAGLIISLVVTLSVYKKQTFPGQSYKRYLLILLRFSVLFLINFIVFFRILRFDKTEKVKPFLAVLTDRSLSMDIAEHPGNESGVDSVLSLAGFKKIFNNYNVVFCSFGSNAVISKDISLKLPDIYKNGTNISLAMEKAKSTILPARFSRVILLSDGNYNLGVNPVYTAEDLGCPVDVIGFGIEKIKKDLEVSEIRVNDIVFANQKVKVRALVKSTGFEGVKVNVELLVNGKIADSRLINLSDMPKEAELSFVPEKEGRYKLEVKIPVLKGEFSSKNNSGDVTIEVLKEKIKVLIVAGIPDPDTGLLYRTIGRSRNFNAELFILSLNNSNDENFKKLFSKNFDVVVLKDVFNNGQFKDWQVKIKNVLYRYRGPLLVWQWRPCADDFSSVFSVSLTSGRLKKEIEVEYTETGLLHPVLTDFGSIDFRNLPPLFIMHKNILFKEPVTLLIKDKRDRSALGTPVIAACSAGERKELFIFASGFFRWSLRKETEQVFDKLINNSILWLSLRKGSSSGLVKVSDQKRNFLSGQEIVMHGRIYDGLSRPVLNGRMEGEIAQGGKIFKRINFKNTNNGFYRADFRLFRPGEYNIIIRGFNSDVEAGVDTIRLYVAKYNPEYTGKRSDFNILKNIAEKTRGAFIKAGSMDDSFFDHFIAYPTERKRVMMTDLLELKYLLFLILVLLVSEWVIRKKMGMM